jgi:hypothetical protein
MEIWYVLPRRNTLDKRHLGRSKPLKGNGHYALILHLHCNGNELLLQFIDPNQVVHHNVYLAHVKRDGFSRALVKKHKNSKIT